MASNKRPPLELDDLTNNLKQSSGKGVDAFFSAPPPLQAEKKPVMQEAQDKEPSQQGTPNPVLPVLGVLPVLPVPPVPGVPPKKMSEWKSIKSNVDKYFEKYEGYISSHDYKRADDEQLAKLAKKIRE